ncbi:hypothetical protein RB614_22980 [Phytohabitans sp. ZYX-F-186]|uniref:Chaplin domain-containing protein n=1 Tax=Phytohabitans maris TaxID=3071409 RepID=A0ABU0ZM86_9ACTN|nr:hypothetical protein [Phytohabitans sp. ZYX-F-186]MDQ7907385.1 hypothetical protein [Phytohabitans sp. ZYX-F-186]
MRGTAAVGRVLAAALLAVLALTSVHGSSSMAAPAGAIAHGPASIGAAVVHAAPAMATQDHRLDLTPVPGNALLPHAERAPAAVADPGVTPPVDGASAPHPSRAPPRLH